MEEKISRLLEDESFAAALEAAETDAEVLALFESKGVTLTEEDLKEMYEKYATEELSEDGLEDVAGGIWIINPRPIKPRFPWGGWPKGRPRGK